MADLTADLREALTLRQVAEMLGVSHPCFNVPRKRAEKTPLTPAA